MSRIFEVNLRVEITPEMVQDTLCVPNFTEDDIDWALTCDYLEEVLDFGKNEFRINSIKEVDENAQCSKNLLL
jgi:hypothetical protein